MVGELEMKMHRETTTTLKSTAGRPHPKVYNHLGRMTEGLREWETERFRDHRLVTHHVIPLTFIYKTWQSRDLKRGKREYRYCWYIFIPAYTQCTVLVNHSECERERERARARARESETDV